MRIVFLTLNAYDMLTGDGDTVGGAQLQQVLIGQELASRGHDIIFIENEGENKEEKEINSVSIVTLPLRESRTIPTRAVLRCIDLISILSRLDPDACYVRMPLFELLPVSIYCTTANSRLIYGFAHDSELSEDPVVFETQYTDNVVYRSAINRARETADVLVAQNSVQERKASEQYDTSVVQIPNGYKPDRNPSSNPLDNERQTILWVSTLRPWKRPELVLELADRIPSALFVIVGPEAEEAPDLYQRIQIGAQERENVRFEGFVPYQKIDPYFAAADLFCNTSTDEGFPNTFLQAWAYETPVASLSVDPDKIIESEGIGVYGGEDIDTLVESVKKLLEDENQLKMIGKDAKNYFNRNHSIKNIANKYESIFSAENMSNSS